MYDLLPSLPLGAPPSGGRGERGERVERLLVRLPAARVVVEVVVLGF